MPCGNNTNSISALKFTTMTWTVKPKLNLLLSSLFFPIYIYIYIYAAVFKLKVPSIIKYFLLLFTRLSHVNTSVTAAVYTISFTLSENWKSQLPGTLLPKTVRVTGNTGNTSWNFSSSRSITRTLNLKNLGYLYKILKSSWDNFSERRAVTFKSFPQTSFKAGFTVLSSFFCVCLTAGSSLHWINSPLLLFCTPLSSSDFSTER